MQFGDRLVEKITQTSNVVVGIDPNFNLMPKAILPANGNSPTVTKALFNFAKLVIDTSCDLIPAVKFQSAYFEQFGSAGIKALAQSIEYAKDQKLLVILDAKRGDIGSTSLAYAQAYLEGKTKLYNGLTLNSHIEVDAITVNPFLGEDSLEPFVETSIKFNKGLFILVKTSNPGSQMIQDRMVDGKSISYYLAELVNQLGKDSIGKSGYSSIGVVVGATFPDQAKQLREIMPNSIFLVPGVGSQGGKMENVLINFNPNGKGAIVAISRAITYFSNLDMSLADYQLSMRKQVEYFVEMGKRDN